MDYKEALIRKIYWEKEVKPDIKQNIADVKETNAENVQKYSNLMNHIKYLEALSALENKYDFDQCAFDLGKSDESDIVYDPLFLALSEIDQKVFIKCLFKNAGLNHKKYIAEEFKSQRFMVSFFETNFKRDKYHICCLTYAYNGDFEKTMKYYHKCKALCYELIEDSDGIIEYGRFGIFERDDETHKVIKEDRPRREAAYNEVCKALKDKIEYLEDIIEFMVSMKEAKPVLKAAKRMNQRKNEERNKN